MSNNRNAVPVRSGYSSRLDTCKGDSGGPLLCLDNNGKFNLHGIASYGPTPCGQRGLPGIYTQVSGYRDWIDSNMK
uniref:melanization protease 1-like n=1 Tax=Styela clava TaxID=7725 RepID=UPI001939DE86|nr:melanization protease 1-like [Styela clava]